MYSQYCYEVFKKEEERKKKATAQGKTQYSACHKRDIQ